MPRVHHVKKARKPNPVVTVEDIARAKRGEDPEAASYYYWEFRFGGKRYSKTYPKQSQLTQSEFLSQVYDLNERIEGVGSDDPEVVLSSVSEIIDEIDVLRDEQQDKRDSMPDQLQDSEVGELLQSRYDSCDDWRNSLEEVSDRLIEDVGNAGVEAEEAEKESIEEDQKSDGEYTDEEVESRVEEAGQFARENKMHELLDELRACQYEGE